MSIPDPADSPDPPSATARLTIVMRVVALLGSVVSVSSLWLSERSRVVDDLQLAAEATARPGETLALRAFYLRDVEAPAGPTLEQADVRVRLLDAAGRQIARTSLRRARDGQTMEGELQIPAAARGDLRLAARTQLAERAELTVVRALTVFPEAPLLAPRFREAAPLQQLSLGSLRPTDGAERAEGAEGALKLSPRVPGGACIPEQVCRLLVWVGEPAAQITLRHDAAISAPPPEPASETTGLVALALTVHGPEAVLVLEARRAGQLVAERTVRLPVALGQAQLELGSSLLTADQPLTASVVLPPGRAHGIVDAFRGGRWSATRAFVAAEAHSLALPALGPGLVLLQAHTDKFAGEGAAARVVYVRRPSEGVPQALRQIAARARDDGLSDELTDGWSSELPAAALVDGQRSAAFLLAAFELQRTPLPRAVSGRPRELHRLSRAQTGLRFGVGAVLVLSALVVGLTLMRRGLRAQHEADAILNEGERETGQERNRAADSSVVFVVSLVLVVCLAFLAAALLIVAKPLWF